MAERGDGGDLVDVPDEVVDAEAVVHAPHLEGKEGARGEARSCAWERSVGGGGRRRTRRVLSLEADTTATISPVRSWSSSPSTFSGWAGLGGGAAAAGAAAALAAFCSAGVEAAGWVAGFCVGGGELGRGHRMSVGAQRWAARRSGQPREGSCRRHVTPGEGDGGWGRAQIAPPRYLSTNRQR